MCAASGAQPSLGAATLAPGHGVVEVSVGVHTMLPSLGVSAGAGLADGVDLVLHHRTVAGLAHDFGATLRVRIVDRLAFALELSHLFFVVDDLAGIHLDRARFAGVSTTPAVHVSVARDADTHVTLGAGATIRWFGREERLGVVEHRFHVSVPGTWLQVAAEWPGVSSTFLVRLRAVVPVEAGFHVVGYLPWVSVGWRWGAP